MAQYCCTHLQLRLDTPHACGEAHVSPSTCHSYYVVSDVYGDNLLKKLSSKIIMYSYNSMDALSQALQPHPAGLCLDPQRIALQSRKEHVLPNAIALRATEESEYGLIAKFNPTFPFVEPELPLEIVGRFRMVPGTEAGEGVFPVLRVQLVCDIPPPTLPGTIDRVFPRICPGRSMRRGESEMLGGLSFLDYMSCESHVLFDRAVDVMKGLLASGSQLHAGDWSHQWREGVSRNPYLEYEWSVMLCDLAERYVPGTLEACYLHEVSLQARYLRLITILREVSEEYSASPHEEDGNREADGT